jgi:hypothetical protein
LDRAPGRLFYKLITPAIPSTRKLAEAAKIPLPVEYINLASDFGINYHPGWDYLSGCGKTGFFVILNEVMDLKVLDITRLFASLRMTSGRIREP